MTAWNECQSCDEEFQVIGGIGSKVEFCPFCGVEVQEDDSEDFDEDLEDD